MINRKINICIVEDDKTALDTLAEYLVRFENETNCSFVVNKFDRATTFINNFQSNYDIIFMDIELPDGNGMDLIKEIRKVDDKVVVVFVTNLVSYAVKGYEVHAFDFIVKPISYYNFYVKLLKVIGCLEQKKDKEIWVSNKSGRERLMLSSILYVEVVQHMLYYHTVDGIINATGSLNSVQEILKDHGFALCNSCYLVNLKHVKAIKQNDVLVGDDLLMISRHKKKDFVKALNEYLAGVE